MLQVLLNMRVFILVSINIHQTLLLNRTHFTFAPPRAGWWGKLESFRSCLVMISDPHELLVGMSACCVWRKVYSLHWTWTMGAPLDWVNSWSPLKDGVSTNPAFNILSFFDQEDLHHLHQFYPYILSSIAGSSEEIVSSMLDNQGWLSIGFSAAKVLKRTSTP